MPVIHRIYVDSSVVSGSRDEKWREATVKLMEAFQRGEMIPVLSDITVGEVMKAGDEKVRAFLDHPAFKDAEWVRLGEEAIELADAYIREGVIGEKHLTDTRHIALATVSRVGLLVSWNFKHIVNVGRIRLFNAVNLKQGYPMLDIRSPVEVVT